MARVVAYLVLLLVFPLFAGCLGGDEDLRPFETQEAPRWEAGYSWSWDAVQSGSWAFESGEGKGSSSGESTHEVVHRVVNTEVPVAGEPAYWIRPEGSVHTEGPMGTSAFTARGLQAVGQDDLQPVARFYEHDHGFGDCVETSMSGVLLDDFPLLRFPLEQGSTWQQEIDDHLGVRARVVGATEVEVPAGVYDAVLVEFVVEVAPEFYEEDELSSLASTMRVWYAEEVRNIVRFEAETKAHVVEEGEGEAIVTAETVLSLTSSSLVADAEEALPAITGLVGDREFKVMPSRIPPLEIVSDTAFPLNAANGSLDVTFGLSEVSFGTDPAPGIAVVSEVPRELPWYEAENETIHWSFMGHDGAFEATGPAVDVTLPPGGSYDVSVRLIPVPLEQEDAEVVLCAEEGGSPVMGLRAPPLHVSGERLAGDHFTVEWKKDFEVTHSGSEAADHPLFDVPLFGRGTVDVVFDVSQSGTFDDDGSLVLTIEDGRVHRFDQSGRESFGEGGNGTAVWEARSGGLLRPTGMTFGHTVTGSVHVRY